MKDYNNCLKYMDFISKSFVLQEINLTSFFSLGGNDRNNEYISDKIVCFPI